MTSTNRLLLVLAGAGAWTFTLARADVHALLDLPSDVWRLPALVTTWDELQSKAAQLDQSFAIFHRVYLAREDVLAALRGRRIDVCEAIHRFGVLTAARAQFGTSHVAETGARHDVAVQLLNWVNQVRKESRSPADEVALAQAAAELQCCVESDD
jgi:hypothetical protein